MSKILVKQPTFTDAALEQKRMAICGQVDEMKSYLEAVDDTQTLDHTLQTLKQLTTTLQTNSRTPEYEGQLVPFVPIVHFSPAEKSETQPKFKKTTNSAGRKQKMIPLM